MGSITIEEISTNLTAFDIYKLFYMEEYSFILDSSMSPNRLGRYSFIGFGPFMVVESKNGGIIIREGGKIIKTMTGNPLIVLKEILRRFVIKNDTGIPFVGGAVGFLAYDLCHHLEKLPRKADDDINLPDMIFGFYNNIVAVDHAKNTKYIMSLDLPETDRANRLEKLKLIKMRINSGNVEDTTYLDEPYRYNRVNPVSNFTYDTYCETIRKAREYIRCGDIYQMNLTQRFKTLINRHPLNIYTYLRKINPAPFAGYMNYGNMQILSSSPERFLKITKGMVETRPIKGTMPRGVGNTDEANYNTLKNSIKDRAENLMIVDLMRNDIGRVCKFGSVKVPELFEIERYATVFQMVSTVTGELRDDCNAVDCIMATFPGGSITGAPKIRSMEIIDELEPTCRHIYTGSIGYIGFDGDMDLNIVIRTILVKGHNAYYQVGGGIVWDSVPEREYKETMVKGLALKKALLYDDFTE